MSSPASKRATLSWILYDWANTAFGTVIITFVFSVYFARGVIGDETEGAALWSYAIGISGLLIALMSPLFGAVADQTGHKKPGILFFTLLCCLCTALLYLAEPNASTGAIFLILLCLGIANIGLEMGTVFYNALLPDIAPRAKIGRISGFAWAAGYFGGLVCLVVALFGLVGLGEMAPMLPLSQDNSEHIRATAPLTALWFLVFALPLFFFVKEKGSPSLGANISPPLRNNVGHIINESLTTLKTTLLTLKTNTNLALVLISSAIYRDGLNTLFAVGGLYAAGRYGMDFTEILIFAIGLNVASGLGAAAFAYLDDLKGSKLTIITALAGLIGLGIAILMIEDKTTFMVLAILLGLFIGPAQAASRTLAARLAPANSITQTYGLYAFTGKSIAFTGPLLYGLMTDLFDTQQAGMMVIVALWTLGLVLLTRVRDK